MTRFAIIALLMATGSSSARAPLADIGPAPPTVLVDSNGKPFDLEGLRGKVVLVSFIYTTCNGSCPATVGTLHAIEQSLAQAKQWGTSVAFVSITLDPRSDTPQVLTRYVRNVRLDSSAWHFLTGPPPRVESVIGRWGMWAKTNAAGVIDHPSRIFLLDRRLHEREIYSLEFLEPAGVLADIRGLLNE